MTREWIDPDYGLDFETIGHRVQLLDGFDRDAAAIAIAALLVPTPDRLVNMWLADLAAVTAPSREDGIDSEAKLKAYHRRLEEYPPDVVRDALNEVGDKCKFFPTWSEIKERLDVLMKTRNILREWFND